MKLVLFQPTDGDGSRTSTAMLTQRGVVPVADIAGIEQLIDQFESRRHELERLAREGTALPVDGVRLLPPLPRPGKRVVSTATDDQSSGGAPPLLRALWAA